MRDIDWSNPNELSAYEKAYRLECEEKDELLHLWVGTYGVSALVTAIDNCLNGKKAKTKYVQEPIFKNVKNDNDLSEDDIVKQREYIVTQLKIKKANFDLHKNNKVKN